MTSSVQMHTHPHNFANLKCDPSTIICREKTAVLGEVTIGSECVIHPAVVIQARMGPINIGSRNLIEERVKIINNRPELMIIGNDNVFEVDSKCEATKVGNENVLEAKSTVGSNIIITNSCTIGAGCELTNQKSTLSCNHNNRAGDEEATEVEIIPPFTVISGKSLNRKVSDSLPKSSLESQLDFLRKVLPNYQKLWRPENLPLTPQQK